LDKFAVATAGRLSDKERDATSWEAVDPKLKGKKDCGSLVATARPNFSAIFRLVSYCNAARLEISERTHKGEEIE